MAVNDQRFIFASFTPTASSFHTFLLLFLIFLFQGSSGYSIAAEARHDFVTENHAQQPVGVAPRSSKQSVGATYPSCTVNVCYAIDGSTKISGIFYEDEKKLVSNVVKLLRDRGVTQSVAAVEYGISNREISALTNNTNMFLRALDNFKQRNSSEIFITAGVNYCFSSLFKVTTGKNVIVIIGSGQNTIGSDPGNRVSLFFSTGGRVVTVGVGDNQNHAMLDELTGEGNRISINVEGRVWKSSVQVADSIDSKC